MAEAELTGRNWVEIKEQARPGDVLFLRHQPPKDENDCLLQLMHVLDGPYDHAAVVCSNNGKGIVKLIHVTARKAVVGTTLNRLIKNPGLVWVRAELRRRWPGAGLDNALVDRIVTSASPRAWPDAHYGFGDLLMAALAATKDEHVVNREDGQEINQSTLQVLRARLLALCYIDLHDLERTEQKAGVTCASFVNSCHDGQSELKGPFQTIDEQLTALEQSNLGGADAAARLVDEYRQKLKDRDGKMHLLLSAVLCPDAVAEGETVSDELVTSLILQLLHDVEQLRVAEPAFALAEGDAGKRRPDADRLLVSIQNLHRDENLSLVCVEPAGCCECEQPPKATSPDRGHFHLP